MTNRIDIKIPVVEHSVYGSIVNKEKYDDDTIADVIGYLSDLLAEIPAKYRDRAFVSFDSEGGYEGSHSAEFGVYYYRPETDEEMEARLNSVKRQEERQRASELEQLNRLKKKYGNQ